MRSNNLPRHEVRLMLMKEDQACFLEFMIVLFLDVSAFFQAALNDGDRGDRRHSFSACLAVETAAWQDAFHHGRRGCLGRLRGWEISGKWNC